MKRTLLILGTGLLISGCASDFRCPAKDGLGCVSVEEVYTGKVKADKKDTEIAVEPMTDATQRIQPGSPIRTDPRILRVFIFPWEDARGNLHDESYTYLVLDTGRWILRSNRTNGAGSSAGIPPVKKKDAPAPETPAVPPAGPAIISPQSKLDGADGRLTLRPLVTP